MATETYIKDGIEYTKSNHRMVYNPEFHENHGKPYTTKELIYICSMWDTMRKADISLAVGRTHNTVLGTVSVLRKKNMFEHYKKMGDKL